MSAFPFFLYERTYKDMAGVQLETVVDRIDTTAANVDVRAIFSVPVDRIFILSHLHSAFVPGAGQNINSRFLVAVPPSVTLTGVLNELGSGAANTTVFLDVTPGEVWIPPAYTIEARGNFNAGVAANSVQLSVFGLLIPRGNVALR